MNELRYRIRDLVGASARRVAVHTYHSLALALTERSMAARAAAAGEEPVDFDGIVDEANRHLRGRRRSSVPRRTNCGTGCWPGSSTCWWTSTRTSTGRSTS